MRRFFQSSWFGALFCGSIGSLIVFLSVAALRRGEIHYENYWGGNVFAPFAIVIGGLFAIVGAWKWKKIVGPSPKLKGKALRAAERADQTKFPIDTYKKW